MVTVKSCNFLALRVNLPRAQGSGTISATSNKTSNGVIPIENI